MPDKTKAKRVALYGIMIALAAIMSFIESLIPVSLGIPGAKLGLANLVTIVCLYTIGDKAAIVISIFRIILVGLLFGNMFSILYSLSGGIVSLACMLIAKRAGRLSAAGVSIVGGVMHNIGQLLAAAIIIHNIRIAYYMPVLMLAGVVCGIVIGLLGAIIIKRVKNIDNQIL